MSVGGISSVQTTRRVISPHTRHLHYNIQEHLSKVNKGIWLYFLTYFYTCLYLICKSHAEGKMVNMLHFVN